MKMTIDDQEKELFADILEVMEKHGEVGTRFTLRRHHSHFETGDHELLLEENNKAKRELKTIVVDHSEVPSNASEVEWALSREQGELKTEVIQACCGDRI